jgi:hypothetical protein
MVHNNWKGFNFTFLHLFVKIWLWLQGLLFLCISDCAFTFFPLKDFNSYAKWKTCDIMKWWDSQLCSFDIHAWEFWKKMSFQCDFHEELQNIIYGKKWWLFSSSNHGEYCKSMLFCDSYVHYFGSKLHKPLGFLNLCNLT